jgi:hypothetical protein
MVTLRGASASLAESSTDEKKRVRSNSFTGDVIATSAFSLEGPTQSKQGKSNKRKSDTRKSLAAFDSGTMTTERNSLSDLENPLGAELLSDSSDQLSSKSSQDENVFRASGTAAVYDKKAMIPSALSGKQFALISDDDLTMIEVGDMRIAEELFCKRHLRPPLPVGVPTCKRQHHVRIIL